uniref:Uncharacterized protein n=1 Tax=Anguilla anguilla TaxID=7936 RepID=A0A0E9QDV4_ANGAN
MLLAKAACSLTHYPLVQLEIH